MPRLLCCMVLMLSLSAVAPVQAQEGPRVVEGQAFARRVVLAGTELQLNGTGVRAVAWFKGYAAGLYLAQRSTTQAQALAMGGPKRLQLRMLQEVPAAEFVKALSRGVERNAPAADAAALQPLMRRFSDLITQTGKVRKSDVIDLDLDPTRGMLFSVNGTLRGELAGGQDLFNAVLSSFVGEHPYDEKLKAGLLAGLARGNAAP
jgi:hypothetical protein